MPTVEIYTPLRIHFGLFSFGQPGRKYGGVGAMVGLTGPRVRITPAVRLAATGPLSDRAVKFARRWSRSQGWTDEPPCKIQVVASPEEHVGLGGGTQLALAVASGLNHFFQQPTPTPAGLAVSVGRGLRSAVGTYGFATGGLIVEQGKLKGELISPLDCQVDLPDEWRFALIRPRAGRGLAGQVEQEAFARLPPVPADVTAFLVAEVRERLVPAAVLGRFDNFSESLYEFGHRAGLCFASCQGGPYNGPLLTEIVEAIRRLGVRGVGQSSWGPTLFALLPGEGDFRILASQLGKAFPDADLEIQCLPPNNSGAEVHYES